MPKSFTFGVIPLILSCLSQSVVAENYCIYNDTQYHLMIQQGKSKSSLPQGQKRCCVKNCHRKFKVFMAGKTGGSPRLPSASRPGGSPIIIPDTVICNITPRQGYAYEVIGRKGAWGCEVYDAHGLYKETRYHRNSRPQFRAHLQVCNHTNIPNIDIAYAYNDRRSWISNGWFAVRAGECAELKLPKYYRGNAYIYAVDNRNNEWAGRDAFFCIDPQYQFEIPDADRRQCHQGLREVGMFMQTVDGLTIVDLK